MLENKLFANHVSAVTGCKKHNLSFFSNI